MQFRQIVGLVELFVVSFVLTKVILGI